MNKLFSKTLVLLTAVAAVTLIPVGVKAEGMPCTEATLKGFLEYQTACEQELAVAEAAKAQADANVAALNAQGVTGLELQQATDAAFNAGNVVNMYKHKLEGAKTNVAAITGRGKVEQYQLDMEEKWRGRQTLDATETQMNSANQLAAAALEQLNILKTAYVNQAANAATNPALASNAAAMEAQVQAAEANYNSLKAQADALKIQYEQQKGSLNWATNDDNAAYGKFIAEYGKAVGTVYNIYDDKGNVIYSYRQYGEGAYSAADEPNEWSVRWFE